MKHLFSFLIAALCAVLLVSCDQHLPGGVLIEKKHIQAHTVATYSTITPNVRTIYVPEYFAFVVQCDSCGERHTARVEKAVFDKYNVGDTITAKGYYYGKADNGDK